MKFELKNKKGKIKINSKEVKEILGLRPDFEYVQDITDSINQKDIMAFDCKLSSEIFNLQDIEELAEEIIEKLDESYFDVFFEDVLQPLSDFHIQ